MARKTKHIPTTVRPAPREDAVRGTIRDAANPLTRGGPARSQRAGPGMR